MLESELRNVNCVTMTNKNVLLIKKYVLSYSISIVFLPEMSIEDVNRKYSITNHRF